MDEFEWINFVEKILVDTESITKSIDEIYYKKKFDQVERYKSIKDTDIKFRKCRELLLKNIISFKECLDVNFNLFLALQIHLAVINKEMQRLDNEIKDNENKRCDSSDCSECLKLDEDPLTVKQSDSETDSE